MATPLPTMRRSLTGRVRARQTWTGKMLLQVEERVESFSPCPPMDGCQRKVMDSRLEWRDATPSDLLRSHFQLTEATEAAA